MSHYDEYPTALGAPSLLPDGESVRQAASSAAPATPVQDERTALQRSLLIYGTAGTARVHLEGRAS